MHSFFENMAETTSEPVGTVDIPLVDTSQVAGISTNFINQDIQNNNKANYNFIFWVLAIIIILISTYFIRRKRA